MEEIVAATLSFESMDKRYITKQMLGGNGRLYLHYVLVSQERKFNYSAIFA